MFDFQTPIQLIPGIGQQYQKKFKKLGIETVKDLLYYFPFRYDDFSQIKKIAEIIPDEITTIEGKIIQIKTFRTARRKFFITEAIIEDETDKIKIVWFNQPYLTKNLKTNDIISVAGKLVEEKNKSYFLPSHYEKIINFDQDRRETGGLIPVYSETEGLGSRTIRFFIKKCLAETRFPADPLPLNIRKKYNLLELKTALKEIHFPQDIAKAKIAKKRFLFEDLFILELIILTQRQKMKQMKGFLIKTKMDVLEKFSHELKFQLTNDQKNALVDILKDLQNGKPMNRLLQGDVGSGKTIVAAIATLMSVENHYQVAFMAPTEILANQHFQTFSQLFKNFDINIGLLTSTEAQISFSGLVSKIKKSDFLKDCSKQKIDIIIGTHTLIQKNIKFQNLGLIIIDEQHRFGIEQRKALLAAKKDFVPHLLSMTATPIPRSLALTIWGDLDISSIKELPKNRQPIITKIILPNQQEKVYQFVKTEIKNGRQVFVICPLINDSPKLELKSVNQEYEKLKEIFPEFKIGILHGKLKSTEKEKIMKDFLDNKINILISTSVVEVGIDIPNASIIIIEGAERFGLAQLYQFKGRVGRGHYQSFCFLFSENNKSKTTERLKAITQVKNAFELAEIDLQMRGPGEFLGTKQSGMPDTLMEALKHIDLVQAAKKEAEEILNSDPHLQLHPLLKEKIENQKDILEIIN